MKNKGTKYGIILLLLILALTGANLLFGSVNIPAEAVWHILTGNEVEKASWSFIVWESRLPQAVTALLCGMALASSGLMLQTTFNNPLADPSILGISSGASLGVALVMLAGAGTITAGVFTLSGFISVIIGAFIGSMLVMGIILFFSTLIKNSIMLLIIGIMIGYITSSAISLLNFFSTAEGVHSYMIWGMGNFGGVSLQQLPFFSLVTATGLLITILLIKPLNALLLGTRYAENLGINIRRTRIHRKRITANNAGTSHLFHSLPITVTNLLFLFHLFLFSFCFLLSRCLFENARRKQYPAHVCCAVRQQTPAHREIEYLLFDNWC